MEIEKLNQLPCTDIGIMLGDINNLDWMDFEKLEDDITVGKTIIEETRFLVVKYELELTKKKYIKNFQCFFQPHRFDNELWISNINTIPFINTRFGLTEYQKKMIENLIDGKIVIITPNHFPCDSKHIGKRIATPETWRKKRAVEIIERNWIICRYEPIYKMCEQVLMNNIKEAAEEYEKTMKSITSFCL